MAKCECQSSCIFFNDKMKELPGFTKIYKKKYCIGGEMEGCARRVVSQVLGEDKIPSTLYPNQHDLARKLIAASKSRV